MEDRFRLVTFTRKDTPVLNLLKAWWASKTGDDPHSAVVGSDFGFLVYSNNIPAVATFFYPTVGSSMCMVGNFIANPNFPMKERREALDYLVASVESYAKNLNYGQIVTYAGSNGAKALFSRSTYVKGDTDVITYFKIL